MRGIAALYVVLGHFCSMADPRSFQGQVSRAEPWAQSAMALFWQGHLAVAAFIVISGFCLQVSLFQSRDGKLHDSKSFFRRRARRILPAYYACLLISAGVALTLTSQQAQEMPFSQYVPITWENFWAHVFLVHNWSADWMYKINGVLWSIAIEVQLYLLFPVLVRSLFGVGRSLTLLLCGLLVAAVLAWVPGSQKLYPWYLALFALGMAFAHGAYRPTEHLPPSAARMFGVFSLSLVGLGFSISLGWPMVAQDAMIGLLAASLMAAGTLAPWSILPRALAWRPLVGLGGFSYSLYLMHHPLQQAIFVNRPDWVQSEGQKLTYLASVGLPVVLLAAWIFSLAFERPFMRKRDTAGDDQPIWIPLALPLRPYEPKVKPKSRRGGKSSSSPDAGYGPEQSSATPS